MPPRAKPGSARGETSAREANTSRRRARPSPQANNGPSGRTKARGPATLADLVLKVYPSRELDDLRLIACHASWWRHVPKRIVANARPHKLRGTTLTLTCTTSTWSQELTFMHDELLTMLHSDHRLKAIEKLRFVVGHVPEWVEATLPPLHARAEALPEDVAQTIAQIGDAGLQSAIAGAVYASLSRKQEG